MYLKTLEIQGFKSFPDRTVIDFHSGVTAIVGPNGSGKSNVTDAIRFVLGEQSVRSLRGMRMEDVIFTGTATRRAMNYAEVRIVFDNQDHQLPVEYSEICLTRRLYRSGESEYLLNQTACRLKDITTLLMDTGLGQDGYSIVGQGRIDDILSHRSEDRRRIFEEASGIVKFKTRKEESERKLQQTAQNLLRVNDLIQELTERIEPLAAQAEVARKFLRLSDELKSLEVALILETIDQIEGEIAAALEEKQQLEEHWMQEQDRLVTLRDEQRATTESIRRLELEIEETREQYNQINTRLVALSNEKTMSQERLAQLKQLVEQRSSQAAERQMKQRELDLDRTARETKVETLRHQQAHFQEQLQIVQTDMQTILDQLSAAEQQTEELKSDLETRSEALFEKKNHLGKLQSQAALLLGRQKTVANELVALVSQSDQLILTTEERDDSLKQTQTTMAALELEKQRILESLEQIKATRGELQDQMNTWRQSLQNDQYRLQTLTELERRREGYSDTARRLMAKASQDPAFGRGITGILGELITVEPGLELALETALGPALSHLVTDTEATAGRLIAFLKQNRAGRATFLPVATIHGHRLEGTLLAQIQTMPGFVGLACDLVSARADLKAILESLLGRIVIARHLDAATQMARQIHYACRFVTLDGDVVNPGGSLTGGFNQKATSNVLGRGREIENLQQQIAATQTKCEELTAQLHDNEQMLQDLTHQLETCEQEWLQLSHQKVREEAQMEALAVQSHQLQLRNQHLSAEQDTLLLQQDQLKRQIAETQREIQAEEMALQAVRQQISRQDGASKRDQLRRDELREELSDLKVSLHSIDESLRSAQEIIDRINQEREALIRQQNQSQKEAAALEAEILERTSQCQDLDKKIRQLHEDSLGLAEQVRQLNRRRENLEASQSRFFDSLEAQTTRISQLQTEIGKADGKIERLEQSADEARNRLWESYELTVQTAGNWRQQIASRTEAGKQVAALKSAIRSLGPVNLASIDEYQAVRERLDFMAHQRDDIVAAQNQLQRVIAELTAAMQRQFSEQFQLINENFKVVFAELFGGGMAEVLLENPDDVLTSGIEIRAQPPGKKLQSLLLLSGGERCLTAIALLFAILKLRPAPFCVLDEVEAALDDANVSRFAEYIRRYARQSQFIVVTHRKGTMEAADRLYGVTMAERGISRILSMQLSG